MLLVAFGISFVLSVIISYGMANFFGPEVNMNMGIMYGAMTALFFVIPLWVLIHYLNIIN